MLEADTIAAPAARWTYRKIVGFGAIGPEHPFTDDYPAANALVTFK